MIPKFDKTGNLTKGIHNTTLKEMSEIFGISSARRKWLIGNLKR